MRLYDLAIFYFLEMKKNVIILESTCLLYTSDAADDSLRVDLGGRRIIKNIWTAG